MSMRLRLLAKEELLHESTKRGFTVVELMVTMAVGAILVVSAIGVYMTVLGQTPVVKERNALNTNLQNALNRINDDVRRSSNVSLYNLTADPNAPTTLAGYTDVPGPEVDTNDQHFWRLGENRLILNQTPVDAAGVPIYDNLQFAAGAKNIVIYYVHDGALYRRIIRANYTDNAAPALVTCVRQATGGCVGGTASDVRIVDGLDEAMGQGAFKVVYYDRNGNPIPYTTLGDSGTQVPDYSGFPSARAIAVTLALKSGEVASSEPITADNTVRMQFRSQLNVAPVDDTEPVVPPTNGIGEPGLMVGPGGLITGGVIGGGDVYVKGKVSLGMSGMIGGSGAVYLTGGSPVNLNVANVGCGTGASYPSLCNASDPPISFSGAFNGIYGRVCARHQSDATKINPFGGQPGLISNCVPPDVDLPAFDKAAFTTSMTSSALSSTASCTNESKSLAANRTYTGDMTWTFYCNMTINGNVYIAGNLNMNNTTIRVPESAGRTRPVIVVNGKITTAHFTNVRANSYGTTPYFISFFSSNAVCSNSPSCTTLTGDQLKQTLDTYTGTNSPIRLSGFTGTTTAFYSYFGEVYIEFFSRVGAVGGQRVNLLWNSNITLNGEL